MDYDRGTDAEALGVTERNGVTVVPKPRSTADRLLASQAGS